MPSNPTRFGDIVVDVATSIKQTQTEGNRRLREYRKTERYRTSLPSRSFSLALVLILPEASYQISKRRGAITLKTSLINVHEVKLFIALHFVNVSTPLT